MQFRSLARLYGFLVAWVFVGLIIQPVKAQVLLVEYDLTAEKAPEVIKPLSVAEGLDADVLQRAGLIENGGSYGYYAWDWELKLNSKKYFSFSIATDKTHAVTPTTLDFTWYSGKEGPLKFELRSSRDGFSSIIGDPVDLKPDNGDRSNNPVSLVLKDVGTIPPETEIEFRIYAYEAPSGKSEGGFDGAFYKLGQNPTLMGEVSSVPEPEQQAVITGLGLFSLAVYRNRRCVVRPV